MDLLDRLRSALADRYVVEREIGRGGMAIVYLAQDLKHHRAVAVKVLKPDVALAVPAERFLREIEIEAQLKHPYILPLFDSGEVDGLLYYVMPYVQGESLRGRLLRETQLPLPEALQITREIAEALAYAHARGIVHRDVKPGNILLDESHAVLADFGIARVVDELGGETLSQSGLAVGTPEYMSPEQCTGKGKVDGRSDIYALGCVLYEMLSGEPPFTGPTAQVIIARHLQERPRSLKVIRSTVPDHVEEAIRVALEKIPADRFSSATQFVDALAGEGETVSAVRRARSSRRRRLHRRLGFAGGLAGMIGLGLWTFALPAARSGESRDGTGGPSSMSSIAVLYFEDRSGKGNLEHLAAGITEDLIDRLAAVKSLRVISPDGVKPFRRNAIPIDSLAQVFNVGTVVTGTLNHAGDRLRASVRLVDAGNGVQLFSGDFEHPMGDVLELTDQMAEEVARQLRIRLGEAVQLRERRAGTTNGTAWNLLQRADQLRGEALELPARDSAAIAALVREADSLAARAEELDPNWIEPTILRGWLAYDQADRAAGSRAESIGRSPSSGRWIEKGIAYADHALEKSLRAPEALELRGSLLYRSWALATLAGVRDTTGQLVRAERDLRVAAGIPHRHQARSLSTLSAVLQFLGKTSEANLSAGRAYEADAYLRDAATIVARLFDTALNLKRYQEAEDWCEKGREAFPKHWLFLMCRLRLMAWSPRVAPSPESAWQHLAELDTIAGADVLPWAKPQLTMIVAAILARAGLRDSAEQVIARARQAAPADPEIPYYEALARISLGQEDQAARLLRIMLEQTPNLRLFLRSQFPFDRLWDDPGLHTLPAT